MDPLEFWRQLKWRAASASIPLIFVTASADSKDRLEGLAPGPVDFLSQSAHREELLVRIRTHLELGRLHAYLETQSGRGMSVGHVAGDADRRHAGEARTEDEARFRMIADAAPALIWASGPDKLCTFFNKTWLDFTGRAMEQELGNGWAEGVHPDDLERCVSVYESSFDARRAYRMEYRLRRKDGEYRWVIDQGAPLIEPGGVFRGYVGSCIDITEIRKVQQADFERHRFESMQVLAGGVAHDFTNLMGSILATADLVETEIAGGSLPFPEIQTIKTIANRAVEMARELMVCEGADKGKIELLNLSHLVEDVGEILKSALSKGSVLKMDLPKNPPHVIWANPTHIRQIVLNLIINAAEAIGDAAGTIRIGISRATAQAERIGILPKGDYVRLEVTDSGCGMREEERTRIFDPFFTTKGRGNGLGLAVVQRIVHSYGGVISVASVPGRGTKFEIFLPSVEGSSVNRAFRVESASPC
jgi:PAS domain S-box-containing protein